MLPSLLARRLCSLDLTAAILLPVAAPLAAACTIGRGVDTPRSDYILGPGDVLALKLLAGTRNDFLNGPVEIISDGTSSLPLLAASSWPASPWPRPTPGW